MIATILTDNTPCGALEGEWGLSIHIEHAGHSYLLDAGQTALFLQNARKLGVDLEGVECGVLSHAHYDHSDGMAAFFAANARAPFYLRRAARLKCYDRRGEAPRYIGIREGLLDAHVSRIVYLDEDLELHPGVHLMGHRTPDLAAQGLRAGMYVRSGDGWRPDAFAHEQSLIFDLPEGLALFSSCSHAGADNILREAAARFPGKKLLALIGGLHLYIRTPDEVRALARQLRETGVQRVITGHCTGDAALEILRDELGGALETLHCGKRIEF